MPSQGETSRAENARPVSSSSAPPPESGKRGVDSSKPRQTQARSNRARKSGAKVSEESRLGSIQAAEEPPAIRESESTTRNQDFREARQAPRVTSAKRGHRAADQSQHHSGAAVAHPPAPFPAPQPIPEPDNGGNARPGTRLKPATIVNPPKRPQSSFTFIAPLRTRTFPVKATPERPSFLVVHENREKERRKEDADDGRVAPQRRLGAMTASTSAQRRVGQAFRKTTRDRDPPADRPVGSVAIPKASAYVAPGGKVVTADGDDDNDESKDEELPSLSESRNARRIKLVSQTGRKTVSGARKTLPVAARKTLPPVAARKTLPVVAARKTRAVPDSDESVIEISDSDKEDPEQLLQAYDALTSKERLLRKFHKLPFLRRSLAVGFEGLCISNGVRVAPEEPPRRQAKVIYKCYLEDSYNGAESDASSSTGSEAERQYQELVVFTAEWICPLCELHGLFRTREMLAFHLEDYHQDVKISWARSGFGHRKGYRWILKIVLPQVEKPEEVESSDAGTASEEEEEDLGGDEESVCLPAQQSLEQPRPQPTVKKEKEPLFLPSESDPERTPPHSSPSTTPPRFTFEPEDETEDVKPRPGLQTATKKSYRGTLDARYPSPPPPSDRLGPAAQYPYLPETDADGQPIYSCRIGGPRLFDLLNTLPMEEFGIMSWEVIDREEELFEMEDGLSDEDKVMFALWNRWMMINRTSFRAGHYVGLERFIDEYWHMIHQAAGWGALRAFLLMMAVDSKLITFHQVLLLLKRYEQKTGMDLWYKDSE